MLRLMLMRSTLAGLAVALLLTACTSEGDGEEAANAPLRAGAANEVMRQDPVAPENGTAPASFIYRARLPSCGSYAYSPLDDGQPTAAWQCLAESLETGSSAELIVQRSGETESVFYYRVTDGSDAVGFWVHDATADEWARGTCTAVSVETGPEPCEITERFDQGRG